MKVLLVVFTLCGQPVYVAGQDVNGVLVGPLESVPIEAYKRILVVLKTKGAIVIKRRIEDFTGWMCV